MLESRRWRAGIRPTKIAWTLLILLLVSCVAALALPPYLEIEDQGHDAGDIPIPPAVGSIAVVQEILVRDYEDVVQTEGAQPVHIVEIVVDSLGSAGAEDVASLRIWNANGGLSSSVNVHAFPVILASGIDLVIQDSGQDTLWIEVTLSEDASPGNELQLQTWIEYWEDREDNPRSGFATDGAAEMLVDGLPPVISCPGDISIECDGSIHPDITGWATATDDCCSAEKITITYSDNTRGLVGCCGTGTIARTWTATDECGNSSQCVQTITVVDDGVQPVISCPGDTAIECDESIHPDHTGWATATDNCCAVEEITITYSDNTSGLIGCCGTGTIARTWTAADECGNSSQCLQIITVVDTSPPVITCPADVNLGFSPSDIGPAATGTATATDNCDGSVDVAYSDSTSTASCLTTIVRTWIATDDCGNHASCDQIITYSDDSTSPDLECPGQINVQCSDDVPDPYTSWAEFTQNGGSATDNCGINTASFTYVGDQSDGNTCPETITRTYEIADVGGNTDTCSQLIVINDTIAPQVSTPNETDLECSTSLPAAATAITAFLFLPGVDASDNCTLEAYLKVSSTTGSLVGTECSGTITRTYTIKDACGNSTSVDHVFNISDDTSPNIAIAASDLSVECDGSGNPTELNAWLESQGGAVVSDSCCGADITWIHDFTSLSDDCGTTGSATVTFTAEDCCGNTAATTATFTIADSTPPNITTQASNLTVECDGLGNPTELNAWLESQGGAVVSDSCCGADITWIHDFTSLSDDCGTTGSATVTFTAEDCCGNTATTSATFTIVDTAAPLIVCPEELFLDCDGASGVDEISVWLASVQASDACGDVEISHNYTGLPGGCSEETSSVIVTFTATDACGNESTCQGTITVAADTEPPVIVCPLELTVNCDLGSCEATGVNLGEATATDNCDPSPSVTNDAPESFPVGETVVLWTAMDACGNTSTCSQFVTIIDEESPTVAFTQIPPEIGSDPSPRFEWIGNDNCTAFDKLLFSTSIDSGAWSIFSYATSADLGPLADGDHTFQVRVTDTAGNSGVSEIDTFSITSERPLVEITSPENGLVTGTSELEVEYTIRGTDLSLAEFLHNDVATAIAAYSGTIAVTLRPGENRLEARATNVAGTSSSGIVVVTYDITPPIVTLVAPLDDQVLGLDTCTVTGVVDDANVIEVVLLVNGAGETVDVIGGAFTKVLTGLTDGASYEIEAQATDAVGNTGSSEIVTIRVNMSQPVVAITSPPSGMVTRTPELDVAYVIGGVDLTSATFLHNGAAAEITPADGTTTITLRPGRNTLEVRAANVAGTSSSGTVTVSLDITLPVVEIVAPSDGQVLGVNACVVTGTVDDPNVTRITLLIQGVGETVDVTAGAFSKELTGLADGAIYEIEARATDVVGNTGSSGIVTIRVNSSQPSVSITSPPSGWVTGMSELEVTYQISGDGLLSAALFHNGVAEVLDPSSGSNFITLVPGDNVLEVRATNVAGTSSSGIRIVTYDMVPPTCRISSPADGSLVQVALLQVEGSIDDIGISHATLIVNGETTETVAVVNGQFKHTITLTAEGLNGIEVRAADAYGNAGSSGEIGVEYAPGKPVVEVKSPANGELVNTTSCSLDGSIRHGAAITEATLYVNGSAEELDLTLQSSDDGKFLYAFNTIITLTERENTLAVQATDEFDEVASSGAISVTVDTVAPVVAITTPTNGYLTNQSTILVAGSVDDPTVEHVVLYVNGIPRTLVVVGGAFSNAANLSEGGNTLEIRAADALGNAGSSSILAVTYDDDAPSVSITSPSTGTRISSASISITYVIDAEAVSAEFLHNGVAVAIDPLSGSISVTLIPGDNTLEIRSSDGLNIGSSGVITVTLDSEEPLLSIELSEPGETVQVTVRSNEELGSAPSVEIKQGGASIATLAMTMTRTREWTGSYVIPEDTTYYVEVTGLDMAGNSGSCSSSFSLDAMITVVAGGTLAVDAGDLSLDIDVDSSVTAASIATVVYTADPRPTDDPETAIFIKIEMDAVLVAAITEMTMTVSYDPAMLPEGFDETTLVLYLWVSSLGGWALVEDAVVDTMLHSITASPHYSH